MSVEQVGERTDETLLELSNVSKHFGALLPCRMLI